VTTSRLAVECRGRRLEVARSTPPGAARTLVFLHEGLGSVSLWREWPWRLGAATRSAVLVYSRYGHGESEVLGEPRTPRFMHDEAAALGDLLARLAVVEPVLVGHSDGASIALLHAAADPAVRGVVAIAPHLFVEEHGLGGIRAAREAFATGDLGLRLARHHRDPWRTFRGWNDVWLSPAFRAWDIREAIDRVACPVLAIQGEADQYGTMAQLDELALRLGGSSTELRLPDCGHAPHRQEPEAVGAAIAHFVASLGTPAG
jgi:pimeloyl-ACP methyl ester carboxylesterase